MDVDVCGHTSAPFPTLRNGDVGVLRWSNAHPVRSTQRSRSVHQRGPLSDLCSEATRTPMPDENN
jgi:hypothetical protein